MILLILIDLNQNEINTLANLTNSSTNSEMTSLINKLKQEINHLVLQLMYERNLRYKYEEQANSLHFIRIERDQLNVEKSYLEKNLKKLVEQYKNEVESCLSLQRKTELDAYEVELSEKREFIE
jgi:hypothetical protein